MRDILKTIKEHFILLFGIGLFTYGFFSFDSGYYLGKTGFLRVIVSETHFYPITTYYYYNHTSLVLLTMGAILIAIGLLKIRKKDRRLSRR